jgi:hypothetical protein
MLAMELSVQQVIRYQGQVGSLSPLSPAIVMRMLIVIPLTQWVYGIAMLSSLAISTVKWRGLTYRIQSPGNIRLVAYHPYQWLDQPIDPKVSL